MKYNREQMRRWDWDWMPFCRYNETTASTIISQVPLIIAPSPLRRLPSILAHKTPSKHVRRVDHSKDTLLYGEMDGWVKWICTHEDVALPTFCLGGAEPLVFLLSGSISSSSNGFTAWIIAEGSIGCCACC